MNFISVVKIANRAVGRPLGAAVTPTALRLRGLGSDAGLGLPLGRRDGAGGRAA